LALVEEFAISLFTSFRLVEFPHLLLLLLLLTKFHFIGSGHGTCATPGKCVCSPGYAGSNCSEIACASTCQSPRGRCINADTCVCRKGSFGHQCEFDVDCGAPGEIEHGRFMFDSSSLGSVIQVS
jgi:hypothetical protein